MVTRPRLPVLALACAALLAWPPQPVHAEPLPEHVVARVGGRDLTVAGFRLAVTQQQIPRLKDKGSAATTTLRGLLEQALVELECERLGITVTSADVDRQFRKYDRQIRTESGGTQDIHDLMRRNNTSMAELRSELEKQVRKIHIAKHPQHLGPRVPKNEQAWMNQIEIVIGEIARKHAQVEMPFRAESIDATVLRNLPRNVVARFRLKNAPQLAPRDITYDAFGAELIQRLPTGDVREMLDQECKAALMASAGLQLTDAQFDQELETQRRLWTTSRKLTDQTALGEVTWDQVFEATNRIQIVDLKAKRYWRGYFALLRKHRQQVTEAQIQETYEAKKKGQYGPRMVVTDIEIGFVGDRQPFGGATKLRKRDAMRIAHDIPRQIAAGVPFPQIVKAIQEKKDPTFRAEERRLRQVDRDRLLWNVAASLEAGQLSAPVQTLDAIHLMRLERAEPAPPFAEVKPVVRESLARELTRQWLKDKIEDRSLVKLRWPLPGMNLER